MSNNAKFALGYVLVSLALFLLVQTLLPSQVPQISYALFKRYISEDKVEQVVISETLIRGILKSRAVEEGKPRAFTTVPVADPDLVKELGTQVWISRGSMPVL